MSDQFVVHRLRAKPVCYTVRLRHFVLAGKWMMGVIVEGVAKDDEQTRRVAYDLRRAADMLEGDMTPVTERPDPPEGL